VILFFIAIFFNDYEFDHYESGHGAKTKKSQLDLYLEEPRLNKRKIQSWKFYLREKSITIDFQNSL